MSIDLAQEGFRRAPTTEERVHEAAKLFAAGKSAANPLAQVKLLEAFTTDDFPALLAKGFTLQALQLEKTLVNEFEPILADMKTNDMAETKLVDLWSDDAFEEVKQGEEYKGGTLKTMEKMFHGAKKWGRLYGLTFELRNKRQFSTLADFPRLLANGAVRGQTKAVTDVLLNGSNAWNGNFFQEVENVALTRASLKAAIKKVRLRKNHRDQLVGADNLVLVYGPGLADDVDDLLEAVRLEILTEEDGGVTTTVQKNNDLAGKVTKLESETLGARLANPNGWALVKTGTSNLPSLIRTKVEGLEALDIRVKKDQGQYVSGGDVPIDQGSFNDDTIWFRGRDIWGIDPGFREGTYASTGG